MSSLDDKFSVYLCHERDLEYLQTIVLKCMQVSQSWLLPVFHDVKTSFSRAELSTGKTSRSTFVDHSGYRFSFWFQCLEDYGVWITCWGGHWRSVHTASPQKKVTKHRHRKCNFCPTINLIQISIIIRDEGSQSWLVISREPRLTSRLYLSLTLFFFADSIFSHADRKKHSTLMGVSRQSWKNKPKFRLFSICFEVVIV